MAGFNVLDMLNVESISKAKKTEEYLDITLDYKDIVITELNKYSMNELEEMAAGIQMAGGLQQPLVLGRVDEEFRLISGHRRIAGIDILVQEGQKKFRKVPCRYRDMSELEFRIELLIGNTFNRKMTDYDRMIQAQEWKEVLQQAKKDGSLVLEKGQRVRDFVAAILGSSTGKVGQLEAINKNAVEEVKEQFKDGNIGVTAAYAVSQLPNGQQKEIVSQVAAGEDIKSIEIQQLVDQQRTVENALNPPEEIVEENENRVLKEQKKQIVSDADTEDDERENAKRLHALKMLEKYYTYLNDEELVILEAMLEDCKRRKREYALDEDCGSTLI